MLKVYTNFLVLSIVFRKIVTLIKLLLLLCQIVVIESKEVKFPLVVFLNNKYYLNSDQSSTYSEVSTKYLEPLGTMNENVALTSTPAASLS